MKRYAVVAACLLAFATPAAASVFDVPEYYNIVTATQQDKIQDVRTFLAQNMSPNFTDSSGRTALSYAAAANNSEIAQLLLENGAKADLRDKDGNTPLYYAAVGGHIEVLRLLVKVHATIDTQNRQGVTPLMAAADAGQTATLRALLQAGADPRKQDFTGRDALSWAAGRPAALGILRDASRR